MLDGFVRFCVNKVNAYYGVLWLQCSHFEKWLSSSYITRRMCLCGKYAAHI